MKKRSLQLLLAIFLFTPSLVYASEFDGLGAGLAGVFLGIPLAFILIILLILAVVFRHKKRSPSLRWFAWITTIVSFTSPVALILITWILEGDFTTNAGIITILFLLPLLLLSSLSFVFVRRWLT